MTHRLHIRTPDSDHDLAIPDTPAAAEQPLSALLAAQHLPLNTRCGGRGLCHACEARLADGAVRSIDTGATITAPALIKTCRHTLAPAGEKNTPAHTQLDIPARALLRHEPSVVSNFKINIPRSLNPLVPLPSDPATPWLGAAVDLGTTTIALLLADLRTGEVIASDTAFNAQIHHGEDVLTRINLCAGPHAAENLRALQQAAAGTIQKLLEKVCAATARPLAAVRTLVVAGNTVMLHLLAGIDPSPIGIYPFSPVFLEHRRYAPDALGFTFGDTAHGAPSPEVHLLPGPAAYVGADLSAGILVTGMLYDEGPVLLVDVGTNGEIVLKTKDRMLGCATAAGPAFEGAGLTSGMRAVRHAIETIRFTRPGEPWQIHLGLIGANGSAPAPVGICGSAYIDFLAEGRRAEILAEHGRISDTPPPGSEKNIIALPDNSHALVLAPPAPPKHPNPILVSERDISRLLQAKAAIAAGITTLLRVAGIAPADIKTLYLAGGFGMHLDLANAIDCGLLPGFRPDQIQVVGNTSLGGALAVLQDRDLLPEISRACTSMESIELNLQPGFEDTYIDNLSLA